MSEDLLNFRPDPDLDLLRESSQPDLDVLVCYLTKDKKGKSRVTSQLPKEPRYQRHKPDHVLYWDLIAAELQHFGANTLVSLVLRKGVPYRTILIDVCSKLKVNFNKKSTTDQIEVNLLMKILVDSLEKMDSEEIKKVIEGLHLKTTDFTKEAVLAALQAAMRMGGFMTYKIAVIVANAVAKALLNRGLSVAGNAALSKLIGVFAGPVGWVLTGIWTLVDIAGPAYRVTIPATIHIAYMRIKHKGER